MLPLLALRHIACEGPGLIETVAHARGVEIEVADLPDQMPYWPQPIHYSAVLVLGGPMSVYDTMRYAWLKEEVRLLRRCRDEGIPVLGICLGAQLLSAAFDSRVFAGEKKEIGWGPIDFTSSGLSDPLFQGMPHPLTVFHWHGDTFNLPREARPLASTDLYPNQAFRMADRWYGLQFHLEVTEGMPQAWAKEYQAELASTGGPTLDGGFDDSEERIRALRPHAETIFHRWLDLVERVS